MKKPLIILSIACLLFGNAWADETATVSTAPIAVDKTKTEVKALEASKQVDLQTVYKREFAFLQAQKSELTKRLSGFKSISARDQRKLQNQINTLERTTVALSGQLQDTETRISESERAEAALEERSEVLDMTYQQAESSLKNYNIDLGLDQTFQTGTDDNKIRVIFSEATELLHKLSSIQSRDGQFYLHDGKQTEGKIIQLGNIASYGVSDLGSGALIPAGGEQMKVWSIPAEDVALAFAKGETAEVLKIFLYESRSKAIEEKAEKTWLSIVDSGGLIGWVIVGLGIFGLLLVFIRTFLLQKNSNTSHKFETQISNLVSSGKLSEAEKACDSGKGSIARVLSSTLRHVKDDRDHMEDIITEAILHESSTLNKFSSTILVIAAVSPLLGLLGTVTGMIETFDIITEFGTGDPKLLSSGISVALVTTELGLIVAIPTLLLGTLLASWSESIKLDMEKVALKVTNIILNAPGSKLSHKNSSLEAA